MRIIAGKYGGRRLVSFKASHIRPTTDRVKEAIFNQLQFEIDGARVLDLFSGTGSLALEALSRGAEKVTAVEMSSKSVAIIKQNKKALSVGDELEIVTTDVLKYLKNATASFDIVLVDPPFTKKMAHDTMLTLSENQSFSGEISLFIESSSQEKIEDVYGDWKLRKRKSYGDKFLSIFDLEK